MPRTEVDVQKALHGEAFRADVCENDRRPSRIWRVKTGFQVLHDSPSQKQQAVSLFKGMGAYMNAAMKEHDPQRVTEPLNKFAKGMLQDLRNWSHAHEDHFLFVEIDNTLVAYVNTHEAEHGGFYIRHLFCRAENAGLNIGKLLLALAEQKAFLNPRQSCVMLNFRFSEKLFRLYEACGYRSPTLDEFKFLRHAYDPCHSQGMVKFVKTRRGINLATMTVEVGATDVRSEEAARMPCETHARYCINEDLSQTLQIILTLK